METVSIAIVGVIIAAAFGYALWPMIQDSSASAGLSSEDERDKRTADDLARLFHERERAYNNILEIDLDREMGKLSEEDYEDMILQARAGAVEILRRLENRGVKEGMVPAHLSDDEVVETAARTARLKAVPTGAQADIPAGAGPEPGRSFSSVSDEAIDRRLEGEISQFRKVHAPGERPNLENGGSQGDRICPSCDAELKPDQNFCAACGEKLK